MTSSTPQIRLATLADRDAILDLVEKFYIKEEPISAAMNTNWESSEQLWKERLDEWIPMDCSHVVSDAAGRIIGFQISRTKNLETLTPGDSLNAAVPEGAFRTLIDKLTSNWANVLKDERGVVCKKLHRVSAMWVNPDEAGRGLGTKLIEESLEAAERQGCQFSTAMASNWISQRVFERLGYSVMGSEEYANCGDFLVMKDPKQKRLTAYYLKL